MCACLCVYGCGKSHPISLFMIMTLARCIVKVQNKMENNRNYEQCARKNGENRKSYTKKLSLYYVKHLSFGMLAEKRAFYQTFLETRPKDAPLIPTHCLF